MSKRKKYGNPAKNRALVGDLQKLMQPTGIADPRKLGGSIIGGGPRERGTSLLDTTDSVLLGGCTVATVDVGKFNGNETRQAIFMTLDGRVNKTTKQVTVGFLFGSDGAAALITELLSVADRFGVELLKDMTDRLVTLSKDGHLDITFLKAAVDFAVEEIGILDV